MKPIWRWRALLCSVLTLGVLPYLVYRLALMSFPGADIRGPFLFASPLIACAVAGQVFMARVQFGRRELDRRAIDAIARVSQQLGQTVSPDDHWYLTNSNCIACEGAGDRVLSVDLEHWAEASEPVLEFAIARALVQREIHTPHWMRKQALLFIEYTPAMYLAALNLWLIIPAHTTLLVSSMLWEMRRSNKWAMRLDELALRRTGNLGGAYAYVEDHFLPFDFNLENRRRHLQAVAAEIGLQ